MDFDRQAIERRDFPLGRRGYDPASVDAHLRALAGEFEELQRSAATGSADLSLASTAGSQVQSILAAAETAAGDIERSAHEDARQLRDAANHDAERTREEAVAKARVQVAAVAQATTKLLERVGSMDAEANALVRSLRAGAGRLATDLAAVEAGMGELYGAASGRASGPAPEAEDDDDAAGEPNGAAAEGRVDAPEPPEPSPVPAASPTAAGGGTDLDGARLIALNMALNGQSRIETERYLAENFQLPDRLTLVDEVYAAIEG